MGGAVGICYPHGGLRVYVTPVFGATTFIMTTLSRTAFDITEQGHYRMYTCHSQLLSVIIDNVAAPYSCLTRSHNDSQGSYC